MDLSLFTVKLPFMSELTIKLKPFEQPPKVLSKGEDKEADKSKGPTGKPGKNTSPTPPERNTAPKPEGGNTRRTKTSD